MLLLNPEAAFLQTVDFSSLLLSLAKGGLHVTKAMNDRSLGWLVAGWAFFLRSCPPLPDLMYDLSQVELKLTEWHTSSKTIWIPGFPSPEDLHSVIQWLKTFPQSPTEQLARFEHHLKISIWKAQWA
ncbi:hypothetical protein B0H13DRAFT_2683176, partial [Mycena leptocephala]